MKKSKLELFVDVESTSLDPIKGGLTELAYIIRVDGKEVLSGFELVKPYDGADIQKRALEVTGKTYDEIMGYPDESEVFDRFITVLKEFIDPMVYGSDFTLIGYNALTFDQLFLQEWFKRNSKKYSNYINYRVVDPLAFLRILDAQGLTNLPSYKLSEVYKAIFNKSHDSHNAKADIRATVEVYDYLCENYLIGKPI